MPRRDPPMRRPCDALPPTALSARLDRFSDGRHRLAVPERQRIPQQVALAAANPVPGLAIRQRPARDAAPSSCRRSGDRACRRRRRADSSSCTGPGGIGGSLGHFTRRKAGRLAPFEVGAQRIAATAEPRHDGADRQPQHGCGLPVFQALPPRPTATPGAAPPATAPIRPSASRTVKATIPAMGAPASSSRGDDRSAGPRRRSARHRLTLRLCRMVNSQGRTRRPLDGDRHAGPMHADQALLHQLVRVVAVSQQRPGVAAQRRDRRPRSRP